MPPPKAPELGGGGGRSVVAGDCDVIKLPTNVAIATDPASQTRIRRILRDHNICKRDIMILGCQKDARISACGVPCHGRVGNMNRPALNVEPAREALPGLGDRVAVNHYVVKVVRLEARV
ncbi:hypothetical protein BC936DRAFT_136647 [Jimgerdemannia flammicorona]|uniref:Uncharacterized protein n=1 Tax=Jimgerdemannia flammicorona TaxID=994334 RepID=A0A433DJE2_9FUNG|nr:hypothetical protein BC936DRAFT_136647 [Jimgerdemannia flammicorona]